MTSNPYPERAWDHLWDMAVTALSSHHATAAYSNQDIMRLIESYWNISSDYQAMWSYIHVLEDIIIMIDSPDARILQEVIHRARRRRQEDNDGTDGDHSYHNRGTMDTMEDGYR